MNFLTVKDDKLILLEEGDETEKEITDMSQLEGIRCMCSSSLDFPEDDTNNQSVINLYQEIRSIS